MIIESREQIRETDFEKILNYYKDKGQFHHQTLTVLYLYTSMSLEFMFELRWMDVYDFDSKACYPYCCFSTGAEDGLELNQPVAQTLTDHMQAAKPLPGEQILKSEDIGVIGFTFRVIREVMDDVWRCCLIEPCVLRQAFKDTELFRGAQKLQKVSPWLSPLRPIPLLGRAPLIPKNNDYETYLTKQDFIRLLNDYLEKEQIQTHVILTLYLYSNITVKDMTQLRWRDVYHFQAQIFYRRILPINVPLLQETTQALLIYMARRPGIQPEDFVLISQGRQMRSTAVSQCIHNAINRLADLRLTRLNELRAWARSMLAPRRKRSGVRKNPGSFRDAERFQTVSLQPMASSQPMAFPQPAAAPQPMTSSRPTATADWLSAPINTRVTKQDLIRLLNDFLEREQFQFHMMLTLFLYSNIAITDMTQIRWRDVYDFRAQIFYRQISALNVPLLREMTQALLIYMARYPDIQPEDFVLTFRRGGRMQPATVFHCVHHAISQLTDIHYARLNEWRVWARETLFGKPSRRNLSGVPSEVISQ
jgi:hypothetical protein